MNTDSAVDVTTIAANQTASSVQAKSLPFRHKTWFQAEGEREVAVQLESLPAGLCFPEDFPEPLRYDADKRQLAYRGFMSHGSFCYLQQLHSDPRYAQALDDLYTSSSTRDKTHRSFISWWIFVAVGVVVAIIILAHALLG